MNQKELLERGYFAKELPPSFETKDFADKFASIDAEWVKIFSRLSRQDKEKFRESKWVIHSIPKVGYSRRLLGLPNPYHQTILCKSISDNWAQIEGTFANSSISSSKPVIDKTGKRAMQSINNFGEFKKNCLIGSYDKLFELKTDISRYYPTIYTHIIPWIIHTKATAKANRTDMSMLGNLLDKNLRESNSGQTFGIPIGPDTSLIVSEIIGCKLDEIIQLQFKSPKSVQAFRYIDDYYVYCDSQAMAEKVFKFLQGLFTEHQLDINEEKTTISKSPIPFEAIWSIELGSFTFRKTMKSQQTDIERFAGLAFKHAKENPKDSVLKFAISCIRNLELFDESWDLYQAIILKIAITEPVTLPDLAQILVSHKEKVEINRVKNVVEAIIEEHIPKGHHFEVSWALWICKELGFKLPNNVADLVFASNDILSILIGLDLRSRGQINSTVSTSALETELTNDSLSNERWLLTYEAIIKGWLFPPLGNPIDTNEYFSILKKYGVQFYNTSKTIAPLKISSASTKKLLAEAITTDIKYVSAEALTEVETSSKTEIEFVALY